MVMSGATFVAVPRERLLAAITAMGFHNTQTQAGRELVVDIHLPECMNVVRVYTSISVDGTEVRESGVDAVRICVGAFSTWTGKFFPTRGSVTLKRTAPKNPVEDRRIMAWIARFSENVSSMIDIARNKPAYPCPKCYNPMVLRKRSRDKKPFLGCANYPQCQFCCDVPDNY